MTKEERRKILSNLTDKDKTEFLFDWRRWAREKQLAPPGDWAVWVLRAGRLFGKTRAGSAWVHQRALAWAGRWTAIVAKTPADARDYMIEGPSGILKTTHPDYRPLYEPSKRRLTWSNGSWATVYSGEEPDQLRGFSGDTAWIDEFAKFQNPQDVWDNLAFGMRELSNDRPRILITSTPRGIAILRAIEDLPTTVTVVGTSRENAENVDPRALQEILDRYEGTRLGRQEIEAEILTDVPGALWTRAMLATAQLKIPGALAIKKNATTVAAGETVAGLAGQVSTVGVWTGSKR